MDTLRRSEGKRPLGIPRRRREHDIRINQRKMWWEVVDWMHLSHVIDQWRFLAKRVMHISVR